MFEKRFPSQNLIMIENQNNNIWRSKIWLTDGHDDSPDKNDSSAHRAVNIPEPKRYKCGVKSLVAKFSTKEEEIVPEMIRNGIIKRFQCYRVFIVTGKTFFFFIFGMTEFAGSIDFSIVVSVTWLFCCVANIGAFFFFNISGFFTVMDSDSKKFLNPRYQMRIFQIIYSLRHHFSSIVQSIFVELTYILNFDSVRRNEKLTKNIQHGTSNWFKDRWPLVSKSIFVFCFVAFPWKINHIIYSYCFTFSKIRFW